MKHLTLKVITPNKVIYEGLIYSITAPAFTGEITILPHHVPLFALLKEGITTVRTDNEEKLYSIGGGYIETDGKNVNLLVSRAYGQDEIDEQEVLQAQQRAKQLAKDAPTQEERSQALSQFKRSMIDLKLLKKRKRRTKNI